MTRELTVQNRQRKCRVDTSGIRRAARFLLEDLFRASRYEVGIHFISATRMAVMNERHLGHEGPTDVITFDYGEERETGAFAGELFICPEVAESQALEFGSAPAEELIRYVVHGLLHLAGFDDLEDVDRATMKREEDRLVLWTQKRLAVSPSPDPD